MNSCVGEVLGEHTVLYENEKSKQTKAKKMINIGVIRDGKKEKWTRHFKLKMLIPNIQSSVVLSNVNTQPGFNACFLLERKNI